jgi:hypothetical protein
VKFFGGDFGKNENKILMPSKTRERIVCTYEVLAVRVIARERD